jgi:pyrroloquinoline quinone biosynthesis protein D
MQAPMKLEDDRKEIPHPGAACGNKNYPKRRADVSARTIEGETLILDRSSGVIHQLNSTAAFIWELCDGRSTIDDICNTVLDNFEIDEGIVRKDVIKNLEDIWNLKLITWTND